MRKEFLVSYKLIEKIQEDVNSLNANKRVEPETPLDTKAVQMIVTRFQRELDNMKGELALNEQRQKTKDVTTEHFQEEIYETVQNLSKEMNEAFAVLHKNLNI